MNKYIIRYTEDNQPFIDDENYNKKLKCEECGKLVVNNNGLASHIRRAHQMTPKQYYDKFLKKEISKLPDCEDKIYVLSKIEAENFLPKAVSTINGIIPYQLQEQELDIILKKAEQYLPFLMEKDAYGTISEKIKQLLTFRIPFYVGPLNRHSDKS